jgi:dethiobiotin synthetase
MQTRTGRIVVVTGTGTGIGKTHFAEALLLAAVPLGRVVGLKPVETGVLCPPTDADRLAAASTFHVKLSAYRFEEPVSPHLAARWARKRISVARLAAAVHRAARHCTLVVVELAGGLFSPLSEREFNADLVRAIRPHKTMLVAPDRLGVLHDVVAATLAARATRTRLDAVVLVAPDHTDPSTGRNASEVELVARLPVAQVLPRASADVLADLPAFRALVDTFGSAAPPGGPRRSKPRA